MSNKAKYVSWLLTIGAVLETAAGLGFIFIPDGSQMLLSVPVNEAGLYIARLAGGGLLGLAIACWFARKTPLAPAGMGAYWGLLIYNIVGCATLVQATTTLSPGAPSPAFGAFVHGTLSVIQIVVAMQRNPSAISS